MHTVEVSTNGLTIGTIRFRGIALHPATSTEQRRYKCDPKECVPKKIIKRIADSLSAGRAAGHEDVYQWRS